MEMYDIEILRKQNRILLMHNQLLMDHFAKIRVLVSEDYISQKFTEALRVFEGVVNTTVPVSQSNVGSFVPTTVPEDVLPSYNDQDESNSYVDDIVRFGEQFLSNNYPGQEAQYLSETSWVSGYPNDVQEEDSR